MKTESQVAQFYFSGHNLTGYRTPFVSEAITQVSVELYVQLSATRQTLRCLEHVQRRVIKQVKDLEHKSSEEQLRELGLFSLVFSSGKPYRSPQLPGRRLYPGRGLVSSPRQQVTGQMETSSSCISSSLDWVLGISSLKTGFQAVEQAAVGSG